MSNDNPKTSRFVLYFVMFSIGYWGCHQNTPPQRVQFVRTQGKQIVTPDRKPIKLRGINLGNWLLPEGYMFKLEVATAHWQIQQVIKELVGPAEALAFWKQYYDTYITQEDIRYLKQKGYEKFNPLLEPLYKRLVAAIREVDPHHLIFLGGAQWNSNFNVFSAPFDSNLVYTFHKYWTPPELAQIQSYLDFREKYNVPLWLGESGENTDEWISTFRQLLENNDIGWCFWPYKKMAAASCVRSFKRPQYWDEIVAFAKVCWQDPEAIKQHRPPIEHSRAALAELLSNIKFVNNQINPNYITALVAQE